MHLWALTLLALSCAAPTSTAPTTVSLSPPRAAPSLGFGSEFLFQTADDGGLTSAIVDAHSTITRFPGGTPADYWEWEEGWMYLPTGPGCGGCDRVPWRPTTLPTLHKFLASSSQASIFVLNTLTSNLSHQLAGVHAHAALLPPSSPLLLELGNEIYDASRADVVAKYPLPQDYARAMRDWTAAIKGAFPNATVSWVASSSSWTPRESGWNTGVFAGDVFSHAADAASIHLYPGLPSTPLSNASAFALVLGGLFSKLEAYSNFTDATIPPRLRLLVTEWGTWGNDAIIATWLQALYHTAFLTLLPLSLPRVDIITPYCAVCGDPNAPAFVAVGCGAVVPPNTTVPPSAWHRTASGHGYALLFAACHGAASVQGMYFSPNPPLSDSVPSSRTLVGLRATDASGVGVAAVVTNLGASAITIDASVALPTCTAPSAPCAVTYAPATLSDAARQGLRVEELSRVAARVVDGRVVLPPYAVGVIACGCAV